MSLLKTVKIPQLVIPNADFKSKPYLSLLATRFNAINNEFRLYPILFKSNKTGLFSEKLKLKRQKAKWYHDRSTRTLPELEVGQEVRVAPLQKNETWKQGTCLEKLSDRSYLVKPEGNGQVVRQNREFLKPSEKPAVPASDSVSHKPVSEPVPVEESQPLSNNTQSVVPEGKQTVAKTPPAVLKTRTRVVKLPSRFKDYVT